MCDVNYDFSEATEVVMKSADLIGSDMSPIPIVHSGFGETHFSMDGEVNRYVKNRKRL